MPNPKTIQERTGEARANVLEILRVVDEEAARELEEELSYLAPRPERDVPDALAACALLLEGLCDVVADLHRRLSEFEAGAS